MFNQLSHSDENKNLNLIHVDEENCTVSARELHEFLEVKKHFTQWFDDQKQWFDEDIDYQAFNFEVKAGPGLSSKKDYAITLDCAKEISMMSKVKRGKEARKYFIEVEKRFRKAKEVVEQHQYVVPQTKKELLLLAYQQECKIEEQQKLLTAAEETIKEAQPKVEAFDMFINSEGVYSVEKAAKLLGYENLGRNKLFKLLRMIGMLQTGGDAHNVPYQNKMKYFKLKISVYEGRERTQTYVTAAGLEYIRKQIAKAMGA